MKHEALHLRWAERPQRPLSAAYLPGVSPAGWMKQLSEWGIPLLDLRCFALPTSRSSPETAGLWVVFPVQHGLKMEAVQYPYGNKGRLWLPLHATLRPAVTEEELDSLCNYHWQIFHPTIGFVGFQKDDVLDLSSLLQLPSPADTNWLEAVAAPPMAPPLKHLSPPPVPSLGFIEAAQQQINSSEEEITEDDDSLQSRVLRKARDIAKRTGQHKIVQALNDRLREIAQKRMSEVSRLSDLLDKDPLKALKYAPPLKSSDDHRGRTTDEGDSRLMPRNIDFNLNRLGGGQRAASWGVGAHHYHNLRQKYYRLATQLMEAGEIRKAAYVYAHLLEDFQSAANVLRQGGYYLEAAALYREKLNAPRAEADCLKEGQYYLEAAKIYERLEQMKLAGDLYALGGEATSAIACYEKEVEKLLKKGNYLAAAKLVEEQLEAPDSAVHILRQGWKKRKQPEQCLTRYFLKLPKEQWPAMITQLFSECHSSRYSSFLDVLLNLQPEQQAGKLQHQFREVALRAVSAMIQRGQHREQYLTHFITEDRLLPTELKRLKKPDQAWQEDSYRSFSLNQDGRSRILWRQIIRFFNFTLAVGKSEGKTVIARADSRGYVQLKKIDQPPHYAFTFLLNRSGYEESTYHIVSGHQQKARQDTWKGDTVFPDVHLVQIDLLDSSNKAVGLTSEDGVVLLELKKAECFLNCMLVEGKNISITSRMPFAAEHISPTDKLGWRLVRTKGNYFFTCSKNSLFIVDGEQLYISEPLHKTPYTDYDANDGDEDHLRCLYATTKDVSLYRFNKRSKTFHLNQQIKVKGRICVARYLSARVMLIALRDEYWYLYVLPEGKAHHQWRRHKTLPLPSRSRVVDVLPHYPSRSSFSLLCRNGQVYFYDLREWLNV